MIAACGGAEDSTWDEDIDGDSGLPLDDGGFVDTDASVIRDGGFVGKGDAGFEGDAGRHQHGGRDGGFFDDGGVGVLDAGTSGPQGPRDAGPLIGPLLRDANGVVLGEILSIQSDGAVFTSVTGNDYVIDINFDGTFPIRTFGFLAANCGGAPYLMSGTGPRELLGNTVVYSPTLSSFLIPSGPLIDGAESSVAISWVSTADPCTNNPGTGSYGWSLVEPTAERVGLPAVTAAPLTYP